jgi:hypothetical protein
MSKISLKHSGGNVVSLNSPTSAPTSADVAFKLPNADGTSGQALVTDASGNLSFGSTGKILQVVSTTKTDTFSTSAYQTFTDITGLSVSITNTGSNKVLLQGVLSISGSSDTFAVARLVRTTSGSDTSIFIGDASSNRSRATFGLYFDQTRGANQLRVNGFTFLDTPSAGTHTYKIQVYRGEGGSELFVNRSSDGTDSVRSGMVVSSITVSEVAA